MTLEIIASILLGLGIILTAIPTVPGMLFMFLIVLIYGIADKFETMNPWFLALFGGLVLVAILTDYASGIVGAKFGGASKKSILAGLIGMLIGLVIFPPFGLFIGLFLGVLTAEIIQAKKSKDALKAASYSFIGTLAGMVLNVVLAIAFLVSFLIIVF